MGAKAQAPRARRPGSRTTRHDQIPPHAFSTPRILGQRGQRPAEAALRCRDRFKARQPVAAEAPVRERERQERGRQTDGQAWTQTFSQSMRQRRRRRESKRSPLRRKLDEKDQQLDELQADLVIVVTASPSVHHNMTPRPAGEAALSHPGVGRRNGTHFDDADAQCEGRSSRGVWVNMRQDVLRRGALDQASKATSDQMAAQLKKAITLCY